MQWNPFAHQGNEYGLQHLNSFEWNYTAQAGGKRPERTYKFHVTFSMHCFTRNPRKIESVDNSLWYEGPKEKRLFCFDRYYLTYRLPDIIQSLGDRTCWHTAHGSFFTIEIMTQEGICTEYEVYFDITRASRKGWLNLIVQSAYIRTKDYQTLQPRKRKIRLDVIAYKRQQNQIIRRGR